MVASIPRLGAAAMLLATSAMATPVASKDSCPAPEVRYVYVEANSESETTTSVAAVENVEIPKIATRINTTAVFGPVSAPDVDKTNLANVQPATSVSLFYGSAANSTSQQSNSSSAATAVNTPAQAGSVNLTLTMNSAAVVLENIDAVDQVYCDDNMVVVTFTDSTAFDTAVASWSADQELVLVTNHLGNCDAELERGFFKANAITSDKDSLAITASSTKEQVNTIAESCQMTFSSIPAAALKKRLDLNPTVGLNFADGIDGPMTLYSYPPYLNITADEAEFSTNLTFSGYLSYNFWRFKLEELNFDLDMLFTADVELSAQVGAAYQKDFTYSSDDLTYSLVEVPGVISLGPGVAFGAGLYLNTSAAVDIDAGLGINIPDGNVHIDFLDQSNSKTTGWTPQYTTRANISEKAEVQADPSVSVTVQLTLKLLGGLLDLSSGLTATPTLMNEFTLASTQDIDQTGVSLSNDSSTCDGGVSLKSDLSFNLTGFATQFWSGLLYSVETPLFDKCYLFQQ